MSKAYDVICNVPLEIARVFWNGATDMGKN